MVVVVLIVGMLGILKDKKRAPRRGQSDDQLSRGGGGVDTEISSARVATFERSG
jgi:hypothetical protein